MGIVLILGWGSLIWRPDGLRTRGGWQVNGPTLPIEFSRISIKGRLTLVIDRKHGVPVRTRYIQSACATLDEAIENLRIREGAPSREAVGYVERRSGVVNSQVPEHQGEINRTIGSWLDSNGADAAIWTAIAPRWSLSGEFNVEAAVQYMLAMREPLRSEAHEYLRKAPPEAATPVRKRFEEMMLLDPNERVR